MRRVVLAAVAAVAAVAAGGAARADFVFNEILINPPGQDAGREFVEILPTGPTDSLDGVTLLVIDSEPGFAGLVTAEIDLTGLSVGSNGLLLIRDESTDLLPAPDPATAEGVADFGGVVDGDVFFSTSNTFALVRGYTGASDLDPDVDGVIDGTPFTAALDAVGLLAEDNIDGTEVSYAEQLNGVTVRSPSRDPSDPQFAPDAYIRLGDGTRVAADLDGNSPEFGPFSVDPLEVAANGVAVDPAAFGLVALTPGSANPAAVPEPSSLALIGAAAAVAVVRRRRS